MALTENELSFLRLLERTKRLSREDLGENVWKVKASTTYLTSLLSKMQDEKTSHNADVLMQYGREVNELSLLVEAEQKKTVEEKLTELNKIPISSRGANSPTSTSIVKESTSEIRLRNKEFYRADLRKQLLGDDKRRQAQAHVEDVSKHEQMHEELANELLHVTKSLKKNMEIAGDVIRDDNQRLVKMTQQVDSNKERLSVESTRLAHHAYKCGFDCFIIFLALFIFWSFICMVILIKFNAKRMKLGLWTPGRWPLCMARPQSSAATGSGDDWLSTVLPSSTFLKTHIRNPVLKERLTNRITELQMFHEKLLPGRSLPGFDDSSWLTFFKMHLPEERARYLLELSKMTATSSKAADDDRLISEVNEERHSKEEMVYAPGFHSLWELHGRDFRRRMDSVFVSRLLSQERVEEQLPNLIVDCRFMRDYSVAVQMNFAKQISNMHNANWKLKHPFNMSIANFTPDSQLSDIVKRTWLFRYGPPSEADNFEPHPFYPSISARGVREIADTAPEAIMYISWRASQFLPETPPRNVKAVVVCASSDYQPWSSSLSAAQKDGVKAYRIPLKKHTVIETGQRTSLTLPETATVLSAYFSGKDIGDTIRAIRADHRPKRKDSAEEEREFVEKYKTICESLEREQEKQRKYQQWLSKPSGKPRMHRYSREERRTKDLS